MTGNRSLDEFGDAGSQEVDGTSDGPHDAAPEEDSPSAAAVTTAPSADSMEVDGAADPEREELDQPVSTYAWSPDRGPCAACGERVEVRWREGDGLVCVECKEW